MAITYPITLPTTGIESIEWRTVNSTVTSQSPFTFKQQIIAHGGQRWEATVRVPPLNKDSAALWKAALVSLKGSEGTMLLGDPTYAAPRGTLLLDGTETEALTNYVDGNKGDSFFTVEMGDTTKTILAGDYIQVGNEADARLYQALEDLTGNGTLEVWPDLRVNYNQRGFATNNTKGVFRLANNITSWSIDNASIYGISFDVVERLTG